MPLYFLESPSERYQILFDQSRSIAIQLDFENDQPNHFSAPRASRSPLELGSFVGDTRRGGSCNVDAVSLIPHCNGTHTETVGHIVDDEVAVGDVAPLGLVPALLVTIALQTSATARDGYTPPLAAEDRFVACAVLRDSISKQLVKSPVAVGALVIRTLPNDQRKRSAQYSAETPPPFLSCDAMQFVVDSGFQHLLVDFPSVDRMYDDGLLANHHRFWRVADRSRRVDPDTRVSATITEMVYVTDELSDGFYLLDLQTAAWRADAAPSRPALIPLKLVDNE